jgi:DNA-binding beta-propeller fold protein YncE
LHTPTRHLAFAALTALTTALAPSLATAELPSYTLFESDPVTPIALSPDGTRLFAVNTPEGRLEIYEPKESGSATTIASVPVGLEPVAVAARTNSEVWVVNHLSDSVSIVDVDADPPRVVRTLLVGDEPRGIVFAGPGGNRAFIATAHRGQNTPWPDGDYDVPGTGRADVWVFDANDLGTSLEGEPLTVVQLFGDKPRALVASPDGSTVYAAVFRSGNRTTTVSEGAVCNGTGSCNVFGTTYPAGLPSPRVGHCSNDLATACLDSGDCSGGGNCVFRQTGLIVGYNESTQNWEDENGTNWNAAVRFSLPDYDVFEIDANASVPFETESHSGVGTILFNMIVNPVSSKLYVSNTEAKNRVRFEGFGDYATNGPGWAKTSGDPATVRGNLHQSQVTVIDAVGNVDPRHLNKHIPYGVSPVPAGVKEASLGTPMGMAISSDGSTLYVAGFGSNTIGVYDTSELENDTFVPSAANMISVPGPTGLVIDEARGFLWVATTRDNYEIHSVNIANREVKKAGSWFSPEPVEIREGRKFLYDTKLTSSNGEASCSSCHVFGDMDDLAWDLGDPDIESFENDNLFAPSTEFPNLAFLAIQFPLQPFDTLKGPMTTQSLRGMAKAGPMHWRGDRTGPACQTLPSSPECANQAFNGFNPAFPGLVGRDEGELSSEDMQAFTDFALRLTYPPNPIRPLDNSLSPAAFQGFQQYGFNAAGTPITTPLTDTVAACRGCHALDRDKGFFGTAGFSTFENETMEFKVAHLRNLYQKVGKFGDPRTSFISDIDDSDMGPQIRGFGFLHDGSVSTVANFLSAEVFQNFNVSNMEAFMMEFDSDLAPIVGQQTTVTADTAAAVGARVQLLIDRADAEYYNNAADGSVPECDLIAKGVVGDEQRGFFYLRGTNTFQSDDPDEPAWTKDALLDAAALPGQAMTFTCVPPGSGHRMGIDRDDDNSLDYVDTANCSASPLRPGDGGHIALLALLTWSALLWMRRRNLA